ncbi:MAG: ATP-binding protein [Acidobacteriaceae bacterium]
MHPRSHHPRRGRRRPRLDRHRRQRPGPANPDNLFVPLYTTKKSGTGVGLALARQIVEAHGGAIDLRNRPNTQGCHAEVRLPIAERNRT